MRVLVVGTVPPPGGAAARELARVAAAYLARGDEVTVLSPDARSAAHRSAHLGGLRLACWLAALSPRHDLLELRLQPGLPLEGEAGRVKRSAVLLALGYALGRYEGVTLRLDSPIPLSGGVGGRATSALWRNVRTVVVANEHDRELLLKVPGLDEGRIEIDAASSGLVLRREPSWPQATTPGLRESVLAEIRRTAAEERAFRAARRELGDPEPENASAFEVDSRVRPSLQGLSETLFASAKRRAVALARRQRAALGLARSR